MLCWLCLMSGWGVLFPKLLAVEANWSHDCLVEAGIVFFVCLSKDLCFCCARAMGKICCAIYFGALCF